MAPTGGPARPVGTAGRRAARRAAARATACACGCCGARTVTSSSPSPPPAASCTGRGPTRPSAPTSSRSCTPARSATTASACSPACGRPGEIAGVLIVSQIVRGAFQSAYLGYYAHQHHARNGYMGEAMEQTLAPRLRPARAAPPGGQHPARQRRLDRARPLRRLPAGGLLPALPADRRPVARPRALRDHGRRPRR